MSSTVSHERATHASYVQKGRELAKRLEIISVLEMELKGLIDLEKGIEIERGRVEDARRGMQKLVGDIESKKIESKGLDDRQAVSDCDSLFSFALSSSKKLRGYLRGRRGDLLCLFPSDRGDDYAEIIYRTLTCTVSNIATRKTTSKRQRQNGETSRDGQ